MKSSSRGCWSRSGLSSSPEGMEKEVIFHQRTSSVAAVPFTMKKACARQAVRCEEPGSASGQPLGRVDGLALVANFEVEAGALLSPAVADQGHGLTLFHVLPHLAQQ